MDNKGRKCPSPQETCSSDTMLNYHSFQKFKLVKKDKFNYLINSLTKTTQVI